MSKQLLDWHALEPLRILAYDYCTNYIGKWKRELDYDRPASEEEINHNDFVSKHGYEVLAEILEIPREYLVDSRYPSADYSLDKRVYLGPVGFVRFIVYPVRQAPNGHSFLRFYVVCPVCGKEYPVGRLHQHIGVHQKDATLVSQFRHVSEMTMEDYEYLQVDDLVMRTHQEYLLKDYIPTTKRPYPRWTRTVYIQHEVRGGALVFAKDFHSKKVQLDIVGNDIQDVLEQVLATRKK